MMVTVLLLVGVLHTTGAKKTKKAVKMSSCLKNAKAAVFHCFSLQYVTIFL